MMMKETTLNSTATHPSGLSITIILELWKARKFISFNFMAVSFLAVIISLLLPVWYKSSATVLPPSAGGGEILGVTEIGGTLSALGFGNTSTELNNYIAILKSRQLREAIIREFDLLSVYGSKTLEGELDRLRENIEMEITDEGALIFSVYDRDSLRVKALADAMLRELERTTISLGATTGQRNQRFIYSRIQAIEKELAGTEEAIHDFTARFGTFDLPSQLGVVIDQLVTMEVTLATAEIEYNVAAVSLDEKHPKLELLRIQRDEIKKKLGDLISGRSESNLLPNLRQLPDGTVEFVRLTRDLEIQSGLLKFLYPQYEQARLQEAKDEATLLALDYPKVPQRKAKPRRSYIVLAAAMFSVLISCMWVMVKYQWRQMAGTIEGRMA